MINQDTILLESDIPLELLIVLGVESTPKISDQDKRKYISEFPALWKLCGGKGDYRIAQVKQNSILDKKGNRL